MNDMLNCLQNKTMGSKGKEVVEKISRRIFNLTHRAPGMLDMSSPLISWKFPKGYKP